MSTALRRGTHVHDLRHRYSVELRPDEQLDADLRRVAHELEARGILLEGACTAARFHPHATLLNAGVPGIAAADNAAATLAPGAAVVQFDEVGTFGHGRIVYVRPSDASALLTAREAAIAALDPDELDPLVHARPWTAHVTLAYAVPEGSREVALDHVRAALPIVGRWGGVQVWDLDVRPTVLLHRAAL